MNPDQGDTAEPTTTPASGTGRLRWALVVMLGLLLGIGVATVVYAEGASYLSADPRACVNCHIMGSEYEAWQKGSHHGVATCVDCHLPHGFAGKWLAKGANGFNHSKAFTLQDFDEPIEIRPLNRRILQRSCLRCHAGLVDHLVGWSEGDAEAVHCVHCHRSVGHGEKLGLGRAHPGIHR
jgi:cytochrome c nitrite reductase small subunit